MEVCMSDLRVDYLVIVDIKDGFCNSLTSFNNLLNSYDDIDIRGGFISFTGKRFGYEVQTDIISQGQQRYFHLKITSTSVEEIDKFAELLKLVRTVLHKIGSSPPECLWDDISLYYAQKAYPLIYEIENLMRKLITKFMLTTLGVQWTKGAIPDDVRQSVRADAKRGADYLYEVDFIQLSNFLFTQYASLDVSQLFEKIGKAQNLTDLSLDEIKQFVPKSNWERYFSSVVDCESDYLKKRWKDLYDLRCKVAHNRFFNQADFQRLCSIVDEVKDKLQKALDNLDRVTIADNERETVAENMVGNLNASYGEFLLNWKQLMKLLQDIAFVCANTDNELKELQRSHHSLVMVANYLKAKGILDAETNRQLREYNDFRNTIVHRTDIIIPEETVRLTTSHIKEQFTDIAANLSESMLLDLANMERTPNKID